VDQNANQNSAKKKKIRKNTASQAKLKECAATAKNIKKD